MKIEYHASSLDVVLVHVRALLLVLNGHRLKLIKQLVQLNVGEVLLLLFVIVIIPVLRSGDDIRRLGSRHGRVDRHVVLVHGVSGLLATTLAAGHAGSSASLGHGRILGDGLEVGRRDGSLRLVEVDGLSEFGVLLELSQEQLVVSLDSLLVSSSESSDRSSPVDLVGALSGNVLGLDSDRLELPVSRLVLLSSVGVRLLDEHYVRNPLRVERLERVIVEVGAREHVAKDGVSGLEDVAEVRSGVEDAVVVGLAVILGVVGERDLGVGEDVLASDGAGRLNVEDEELDEVGDGRERGEGVTPVDVRWDVRNLEGDGVDNLYRPADSGADGELTEGAIGIVVSLKREE